ncbi:MAG TPA: 3-dehydroquinate synthase [Deltaproteobacteria bacterium]|nr:3-dehydroquinate synthase [Deltaproteobacteria bacterium]HCP47662.1 3-dehydroquinate synthase [Deltaproteobacteria bacterium]
MRPPMAASVSIRPIAISGFMGAGKTTVGERLARKLGYTFVDLDREIEAAFACSVDAIFERFGEPAFRAMEERLLRQAVARANRVVALGGGAVCSPEARQHLRDRAVWVHLDVPFEELARRVQRDGAKARPLWSDVEVARRLFVRRQEVYEGAPWTVDGSADPVSVAAALEEVTREQVLGAGLAQSLVPQQVEPTRFDVDIEGESYPVVVGRDLLSELAAEVASIGVGPIALLTDWNVGVLHGDAVEETLRATKRDVVRFTLPAGEAHKEMVPVLEAVDQLLNYGWQRQAPVVALGGGVLGDMGGLVASLTLRGVPVVQVPTTLMAMVDSGIGGKVGVNHRAGKNLIGTFHQPSLVWSDLAFLDTLDDRAYRSGLAEVVKVGLLGDLRLLELLETRATDVLDRDPQLLNELVLRSCRFKASVVEQDALESSSRRLLNLGHTVGHALESTLGYGHLLHGEAVAIGLVAAAELGAALGVTPESLSGRIRLILESLGLPNSGPPVARGPFGRALSGDKKLVGWGIQWVLLEDAGQPRLQELPLDDLERWLTILDGSGVVPLRGDVV